LDDPVVVVQAPELQEGGRNSSTVRKIFTQRRFFENTDKAFGAAIALRGPDESRRTLNAPKGDLCLEIMGQLTP
jgi:hypothetical protein